MVVLALVAAHRRGCQRAPEQRTYQLHGQVLAVKPESREILVKHDDIPGFMPAMTMPYTVKDEKLISERAPGDLIDATLVVSEGSAWLSAITKTGTAPLPEDAPSKIPAAAGVHLLQPGDPVPETSLTDQDEKTISLAELAGLCGRRDVHLRSVSAAGVLPADGSPLRRGADARRRRPRAPRTRAAAVGELRPRAGSTGEPQRAGRETEGRSAVWRFATAPADIVDRFAATFGVNVIREKDGTITHNLRTAVIGPDGRVVSITDGNQWTAAQIVADLRRALTS